MTILAFILDQEVIVRILRHIGEDPHPPRVSPTRSPPQFEMPFAQTTGSVTWPELDQTAEYLDDDGKAGPGGGTVRLHYLIP